MCIKPQYRLVVIATLGFLCTILLFWGRATAWVLVALGWATSESRIHGLSHGDLCLLCTEKATENAGHVSIAPSNEEPGVWGQSHLQLWAGLGDTPPSVSSLVTGPASLVLKLSQASSFQHNQGMAESLSLANFWNLHKALQPRWLVGSE